MALLKKNQDKPSIGKTNLVKMLQSGQALKAVTLKQDDLPRFVELAKQYGLPFTPVKDTTKKDGQLDVLIHEHDAESVNRVFEVLNGEKVVDDPKKHSQPEQKLSEPNGKTLENNKEMAPAQPIQIEANEALSLPEGLEYRMAKSAEPATFFLYDEKSKQNIPITPKMQQDMQKGIRIPTVKEEKPSVIAKINQAKKDGKRSLVMQCRYTFISRWK